MLWGRVFVRGAARASLGCVLLAVVLTIGACSQRSAPAETDLFAVAEHELGRGEFEIAAEHFREFVDQFPFSTQAELARLKLAQSLYLGGDYENAVTHFENFVRGHPGSGYVPFAEYMIGMAHFDQAKTADRDTSTSELAMQKFETVVSRFPDTMYGRLANYRLQQTRENLAAHELSVGDFYATQGSAGAAVGRYEHAVREYGGTDAARVAMNRLSDLHVRSSDISASSSELAERADSVPTVTASVDSGVLSTSRSASTRLSTPRRAESIERAPVFPPASSDSADSVHSLSLESSLPTVVGSDDVSYASVAIPTPFEDSVSARGTVFMPRPVRPHLRSRRSRRASASASENRAAPSVPTPTAPTARMVVASSDIEREGVLNERGPSGSRYDVATDSYGSSSLSSSRRIDTSGSTEGASIRSQPIEPSRAISPSYDSRDRVARRPRVVDASAPLGAREPTRIGPIEPTRPAKRPPSTYSSVGTAVAVPDTGGASPAGRSRRPHVVGSSDPVIAAPSSGSPRAVVEVSAQSDPKRSPVVPASTAGGRGRFTVQLGSFRDGVLARRLLANVKEEFPDSAIMGGSVGGAPNLRVTSGAFSYRSEADQHLALLKRAGFDGYVRSIGVAGSSTGSRGTSRVPLVARNDDEKLALLERRRPAVVGGGARYSSVTGAARPTPTAGEFTVQVGSFSDPDLAHGLVSRVGRLYADVAVFGAEVNGREVLRVVSGTFPTRSAAEQRRAALGREGISSFVRAVRVGETVASR